MKNTTILPEPFYQTIHSIVSRARRRVTRAVNFTMVEAYWNIGRLIVEQEQQGKSRAAYGKQILKQLAQRLTSDFGKGFQTRNLRYMRSFYQIFPNWNAVRSELSWTHYRLLMRIAEPQKRAFYLAEAVQNNWSTRQLNRQIHSFYYERLPVYAENTPPEDTEWLKDPYVLEFLQIKNPQRFRERELEDALIDSLQDFLLELGKGFAFVARQKLITTESGKHFYIDLVFYHFILKCFILLELKVGELTHENIGQMDMYVRLFEDKWRDKNDAPTIGIILCSEKDQTIVKYSVLNDSEQLFASRYQLHLPTEAELTAKLHSDLQRIRLHQQFTKPSGR